MRETNNAEEGKEQETKNEPDDKAKKKKRVLPSFTCKKQPGNEAALTIARHRSFVCKTSEGEQVLWKKKRKQPRWWRYEMLWLNLRDVTNSKENRKTIGRGKKKRSEGVSLDDNKDSSHSDSFDSAQQHDFCSMYRQAKGKGVLVFPFSFGRHPRNGAGSVWRTEHDNRVAYSNKTQRWEENSGELTFGGSLARWLAKAKK